MKRVYRPVAAFVFGRQDGRTWEDISGPSLVVRPWTNDFEAAVYCRNGRYGDGPIHPVLTIRSYPDGFPVEIHRWAGCWKAYREIQRKLGYRFDLTSSEIKEAFQELPRALEICLEPDFEEVQD